MRTISQTTSYLIGLILNPPGTPAADVVASEATGASFPLDSIVVPAEEAQAEAVAYADDDESYGGPERRAPQVIIAEVIDDAPPEQRYPPLSR